MPFQVSATFNGTKNGAPRHGVHVLGAESDVELPRVYVSGLSLCLLSGGAPAYDMSSDPSDARSLGLLGAVHAAFTVAMRGGKPSISYRMPQSVRALGQVLAAPLRRAYP